MSVSCLEGLSPRAVVSLVSTHVLLALDLHDAEVRRSCGLRFDQSFRPPVPAYYLVSCLARCRSVLELMSIWNLLLPVAWR